MHQPRVSAGHRDLGDNAKLSPGECLRLRPLARGKCRYRAPTRQHGGPALWLIPAPRGRRGPMREQPEGRTAWRRRQVGRIRPALAAAACHPGRSGPWLHYSPGTRRRNSFTSGAFRVEDHPGRMPRPRSAERPSRARARPASAAGKSAWPGLDGGPPRLAMGIGRPSPDGSAAGQCRLELPPANGTSVGPRRHLWR
jgi:hypothetical protein